MKINITIEDATPEELQRIIGVPQPAEPKKKHPVIKGAKTNFFIGPWSDAERQAVLSVDEDQAWKNYQKLFPTSKRTRNGVCRMREELIKKGIKPINQSIEVKQSVKAIALSNNVKEAPPKFNKYGIPSSLLKTDKKLYQRLWARCKAHGIMYDEAINQEKPARSPQEKIIQNLIVEKNGPLHAGQNVRHNGSKASPFFGKVGVVQKLSADGQVYVKFGESLTWISPYSLTVVQEE
jgi:hypothetical protein